MDRCIAVIFVLYRVRVDNRYRKIFALSLQLMEFGRHGLIGPSVILRVEEECSHALENAKDRFTEDWTAQGPL